MAVQKKKNLGDSIRKTRLSKKIINDWNTVSQVLKYKYTNNIEELKPVYAEKYKFDLYGLLKDVFSIPDEYLYPHMIINGYDCPTDFTGEQLIFRKLDVDALAGYYNRFISSK